MTPERDTAESERAAAEKLRRVNSGVVIEAVVRDATAENIEELLEGCDVVLDGSDNFELRFLLNAFRNHAQAQLMSQIVYAANDFHRVSPGFHLPNKTTVDLDEVHRKFTQIAERRVPRAEVIKRDSRSHDTQLHQKAADSLRVLHHYAFGQLHQKAMRIEADTAQHIVDLLDEGWLPELNG